jgi:pentatricopeptide repeat protein
LIYFFFENICRANDFDSSIKYLEEMVSLGMKPSIEDLKVLRLRLFEFEQKEARLYMESLCINECNEQAKNSETIKWKLRSIALDKLFQSIYGKSGPKLATNLNKK